jgi:hypothetical protein
LEKEREQRRERERGEWEKRVSELPDKLGTVNAQEGKAGSSRRVSSERTELHDVVAADGAGLHLDVCRHTGRGKEERQREREIARESKREEKGREGVSGGGRRSEDNATAQALCAAPRRKALSAPGLTPAPQRHSIPFLDLKALAAAASAACCCCCC